MSPTKIVLRLLKVTSNDPPSNPGLVRQTGLSTIATVVSGEHSLSSCVVYSPAVSGGESPVGPPVAFSTSRQRLGHREGLLPHCHDYCHVFSTLTNS